MRFAIFTPYGTVSQEVGVIYLLANYLKPLFQQVTSLSCNGAFSSCARDAETGWNRKLTHCFYCKRESKALAQWSGIEGKDLTTFISSEEHLRGERWLNSIPVQSLDSVEYKGVKLLDLSRDTLHARLNGSEDLTNPQHLAIVRELLLVAMRASYASEKFLSSYVPTLSLVAGGKDILSKSFIAQARRLKMDTAIFEWELHSRAVVIHHPHNLSSYRCELMLEDVLHTRSDNKTWSAELKKVLEDVLSFLEISDAQLVLPIAQ